MQEERTNIAGLDEIDSMIVNMLRKNARLTYSEIGKAAGISRVAARNRVDQLEKKIVLYQDQLVETTKQLEELREAAKRRAMGQKSDQ